MHVVVLGKVPKDGRPRNWKMKWKTHHIKRTFQNLLELYVCQALFLNVAICLILEQVDTNWFIRNHFGTFLCESSISYSQKL